MQNLEPVSDISTDESKCELHFAVSGLWELDRMESFLRGLSKHALVLLPLQRPIMVLGDMRDFVPQTRETSDAIRNHLMESLKYGLKRAAIFGASSLVKMQYKRLSDGLEVEFFESKSDALHWLRRPEPQRA